VREVTLIQIQRAKKKGLTLEEIQHQKKLKQCDAELREMDMIEACREDENREPEVNFEIDA
jgi:DNA-binding transcriptional MerR regulator